MQFGFRVYSVKEIRSLASTPPTHLYRVAFRESERAEGLNLPSHSILHEPSLVPCGH